MKGATHLYAYRYPMNPISDENAYDAKPQNPCGEFLRKELWPVEACPGGFSIQRSNPVGLHRTKKDSRQSSAKRPPDRGRYCGNTMNKDTRGAEEYLERLARSSDEVKMLKWRQSKKLRGSVAWRPHAKPQPTCHSGILAGHHCPKMQGSANPHRQTRTLDRPNKHKLNNHHQAFNM